MRTFRDDLKEMMQNPLFKKRYEEEKERLFLGYQIRQVRKRRRLSQKDLAKMAGLTARQISQIETAEEKVFGFLVGQLMKAMRGKANPKVANEILKKKLA